MINLIAQRPHPLGNLRLIGNIGLEKGGNPVAIFARVLSIIIGFLTIVAALYFMFVLITGAIGIISAGGDKGALETARSKITMGIVGLVVVIAAMFIMDLIATLLGIQGILDIGAMINAIRL